MLQQILTSDTGLMEFYDFEKNIFKYGQKAEYSPHSLKDRTSVFLKEYISNDLYSRITIRPKHESLKLVKDKDFSDKTQWGLLIHKAMSYINKPGDIPTAVDRMANEGLITGMDSSSLQKYLKQIFSIENVKSLFQSDYEVKSECTILLPDGNTIRPDRVLVKNENAIVLDYKTGKEKDEHKKQVNKYAETLEKMGYKSVEKYLLYVETPNLVKVN
jgi:ATP-dependent exoDNAse (exonuclease V) beta subunit